jgi:hypothetical protein
MIASVFFFAYNVRTIFEVIDEYNGYDKKFQK